MKLPFFTIGHSTRTIEEFAQLLTGAEVTLLVDIRTVPRSRTNPQFNQDTLPASLAAFDIAYARIATLGGLRSRTKSISPETNGFWENQSFHNYADYALTEQFHEGFEELIALGHKHRCAIMCSEAVWWRCHRRIVADYLLVHGETVFHLMGQNRTDPVHLTPGAIPQPNGTVLYPHIKSEQGKIPDSTN